jgi:integrase
LHAVVFPAPLTGAYQRPRAFSNEWARVAASTGFDGITCHALRHTHVSQLHDAGVDVVTISKRLGHRSVDVTLRIYNHMFESIDSKAAAAIDDLGGARWRVIHARVAIGRQRSRRFSLPHIGTRRIPSADGWPSG